MSKGDRFELPTFDSVEKDLYLSGEEICLTVDFDDVDHQVVEELTKLIVETLNEIPDEIWDAAVLRGRERSEDLEE